MAERVDLGFSEFVAKLVSDTLDAVVTAAVDQESRLADLAASASLPLADFARRQVEPEQVDAALVELFPASGEQPAGVAAGTPYRPAKGRTRERPALRVELGIEVGEDDLDREGDRLVVSEALAERVRDVVREELAVESWTAVRALAASGLPRVVVDAGRIVARQTMTVEKADATPEVALSRLPLPARGLPGRLGPPSLVGRVFEPRLLPDIVLKVRPVSDRDPQPSTSGTVYGEVEISFKTVL